MILVPFFSQSNVCNDRQLLGTGAGTHPPILSVWPAGKLPVTGVEGLEAGRSSPTTQCKSSPAAALRAIDVPVTEAPSVVPVSPDGCSCADSDLSWPDWEGTLDDATPPPPPPHPPPPTPIPWPSCNAVSGILNVLGKVQGHLCTMLIDSGSSATLVSDWFSEIDLDLSPTDFLSPSPEDQLCGASGEPLEVCCGLPHASSSHYSTTQSDITVSKESRRKNDGEHAPIKTVARKNIVRKMSQIYADMTTAPFRILHGGKILN